MSIAPDYLEEGACLVRAQRPDLPAWDTRRLRDLRHVAGHDAPLLGLAKRLPQHDAQHRDAPLRETGGRLRVEEGLDLL